MLTTRAHVMLTTLTITALTALLLPTSASAIEVSEEKSVSPTLGARVGGYGFRQVNEDDRIDWLACRMDGIGIYGTLEMPRAKNLFAELSADLYFATARPQKEGLDRVSLHTAAVGGVRLFPGWLITPNIHAGGGLEYTWVELYGHKDQRAAPVGFMGVGGELNVKQLALGITVRGHLMQLPVYDWQPDANAANQTLEYESEVAGQMLFSVRYAM